MMRLFTVLGCVAVWVLASTASVAADITGDYMEARTCDVYTGPCFANAEIGLAGKEAILAWSIDKGQHNGVDLTGLKVIMAVCAQDTLGFGGGLVCKPDPIRSVVLVDEKASPSQRDALVDFAKKHAGKAAGTVVRVATTPIEMNVDFADDAGVLKAGKIVELTTRKLKECDCVCTNEVVFYPPLAKVEDPVPALNVTHKFAGRGLPTRWSNPNTRSAFLATFSY